MSTVELDYTDLFESINTMVQVFTEGRAHPQANCGDICVRKSTNPRKPFAFRVSLMIGYLREMSFEVDVSLASINPRFYFDGLIEHINEIYKRAQRDFDAPQIFLPHQVPKNALSDAINRTGAVH